MEKTTIGYYKRHPAAHRATIMLGVGKRQRAEKRK
jgi:hypothetical protein